MKVLTTPVLRERAGFERPSTLLRNRGSFMSPGERVYAAVPASLGSLPDDQPPNRLGLARWLVSPENPLTARVTVNRYWETLFGRGLVATVEDFGTQGERPSHPELLDWLAVEFVEKGWSQKTLLREIVTLRHLPPVLGGHARASASATPRTACWRAGPASGSRPRWCATWRSRRRACSPRRSAGRASTRCSPRGSGTSRTAA